MVYESLEVPLLYKSVFFHAVGLRGDVRVAGCTSEITRGVLQHSGSAQR